MYSFKKNIKYMILFAVLAILSIWGIFAFNKNCSISVIIDSLQDSNPLWIILALVFMMGFILFEGFALSSLIRGLGFGFKGFHGALYSAADIYFSAITPSASGGQPASAYFMIKSGISPAQTTVVLLVNLVLYSISLLIFGFIALIPQISLFCSLDILSKILILAGTLFMFGLCICFILLLTKKNIIYKILLFFINIGCKLKIIKHPEKFIHKLDNLIEQYDECSQAVVGKRWMILEAFVFNLLQRLSHTMVSVCCYFAMGGSGSVALHIGEVQMFCSLGANSIPIPGGMGVTDYLLIKCFEKLVGEGMAGNLALISRGMAFYGSIAASIIIILTGCLISWIKKRKC